MDTATAADDATAEDTSRTAMGLVAEATAAVVAAVVVEEKTPLDRHEPEASNVSANSTGGLSGVPTTDPLWRRRASASGAAATAAAGGALAIFSETKSAESSPILSRRSKQRSSMPALIPTTTTHLNRTGEAHNLQHPPLPVPPRLPAGRRLRVYPSNRTGKWVTREIAALDFLTGVRMRNEASIRAQGTHGVYGGREAVEDADELLPSTTGINDTGAVPTRLLDYL